MGANAKRVLVSQLGVVASLGRLNGGVNLNVYFMECFILLNLISHHQFY